MTDTIREQADSPLSPIAPETLPWRLGGDPDNTSVGPIAIQVRRGAEVLGYDPEHLTDQQRGMVETALQDPAQNMFIASEYLAQLKAESEFADVPAEEMTPAQYQELAARYNGGPYWETDDAQAYFCWTALTITPSGTWDDDGYAGIVLSCVCVVTIAAAGAAAALWLVPSVRRAMPWLPALLLGVVAGARWAVGGQPTRSVARTSARAPSDPDIPDGRSTARCSSHGSRRSVGSATTSCTAAAPSSVPRP